MLTESAGVSWEGFEIGSIKMVKRLRGSGAVNVLW